MRCQRCPKPATLHITELLGEGKFEELHFCEECAQKHLFDPNAKLEPSVSGPQSTLPVTLEDDPELAELHRLKCPKCGMQFKDFRSIGRLGCPDDYELFRKQLVNLLENIHGEKSHTGKRPRSQKKNNGNMADVGQLKKLLLAAVSREDYEEAAQIRDRIRKMEEIPTA